MALYIFWIKGIQKIHKILLIPIIMKFLKKHGSNGTDYGSLLYVFDTHLASFHYIIASSMQELPMEVEHGVLGVVVTLLCNAKVAPWWRVHRVRAKAPPHTVKLYSTHAPALSTCASIRPVTARGKSTDPTELYFSIPSLQSLINLFYTVCLFDVALTHKKLVKLAVVFVCLATNRFCLEIWRTRQTYLNP